MSRYSGVQDSRFPQFVPDGTVKVTDWEPGKKLVSLGRAGRRGQVKHLGVLNRLEALAVYTALEQAFDLTELIAAAEAAQKKSRKTA